MLISTPHWFKPPGHPGCGANPGQLYVQSFRLKHKMEHTRLLKEADDMLRNFDGAFQYEDWPVLAAHFRHWISRHNDRHDKALHGFVRQLKAGA